MSERIAEQGTHPARSVARAEARADRRLGRTVDVDDPYPTGPRAHDRRRTHLATDDHGLEGRGERRRIDERQDRRRQIGVRDGVGAQSFRKEARHQRLLRDHERGTREERRSDVRNRSVEGGREREKGTLAWGEIEGANLLEENRTEPAMADAHPLRTPRGARGVNDVREIVPRAAERRAIPREGADRGATGVLDDDDASARLAEQGANTAFRCGGIDGEERGPGVPGCQHTDDVQRRAPERECHHVSLAHARGAKIFSQAPRLRTERGEG
jgi:hypothetical protein